VVQSVATSRRDDAATSQSPACSVRYTQRLAGAALQINHKAAEFGPVREEGVLRIFVALKNPSPWPGSNPRRLDPVASILTTTRPRSLECQVVHNSHCLRPSLFSNCTNFTLDTAHCLRRVLYINDVSAVGSSPVFNRFVAIILTYLLLAPLF
jgi:hypothetical protein